MQANGVLIAKWTVNIYMSVLQHTGFQREICHCIPPKFGHSSKHTPTRGKVYLFTKIYTVTSATSALNFYWNFIVEDICVYPLIYPC